ncbi:uncharacterized protein LOC130749350 [Lotus japonicus]|uniref:uncharacterized protein LOC130749350 n=1 Tax=Lotus japonicus TaxID=34305 RepID=UPI00258B2FB9|nr:uncharacterized protein LOC130749350 [Lotus japonicus]
MSPTNNILSQVRASAAGMSLNLLDEEKSRSYGLLHALKDLSNLQRLWVKCDSEVQLNQSVERILDSLKATNCAELERTPSTSHVPNNSSSVIDCHSQVRISGSKNSSTSLLIQMGMKCRVSNILKEIILQKNYPIGSGLLPSDNYPDWLTFNSGCSSVTFEVPQVDGRNLKAIMCIVYSSSLDNITSEGLKNLLLINCTKNTIQLYKKDALDSFHEEKWLKVVSNIEPGNEVKVVVVFENGFTVKKTVVYLIYDEPIDKKAEHYHEPDKNAAISGGDENRFVRLFSILPACVRAVLTSKPFWLIGLAVILIWSRYFSNQRRRHKPILRGGMKKMNQSFYERWVDAYQQGIYSKYFKFLKVIGQVCKTRRMN